MAKDLFERTPEFLAAFRHIVANGFFEDLKVECSCFDGRTHLCVVRGIGIVPNKAKYAAPGVTALVDPEKMIEAARKQAAQGRKLTVCNVEVKTGDWPLWNESGNEIIGSKGTKTSLSMVIAFEL